MFVRTHRRLPSCPGGSAHTHTLSVTGRLFVHGPVMGHCDSFRWQLRDVYLATQQQIRRRPGKGRAPRFVVVWPGGALPNSLISLIVLMDHPFRGEMGVSASAFELVYDQLLKP